MFSVILLSGIILNVALKDLIMLSVIMLSGIIPSVTLKEKSVITPCAKYVIMFCVVMLSVNLLC